MKIVHLHVAFNVMRYFGSVKVHIHVIRNLMLSQNMYIQVGAVTHISDISGNLPLDVQNVFNLVYSFISFS